MNDTVDLSKMTSKGHRCKNYEESDLRSAFEAMEYLLFSNQMSPEFLKDMQKVNNKKHRMIDEPFKPSCEQ